MKEFEAIDGENPEYAYIRARIMLIEFMNTTVANKYISIYDKEIEEGRSKYYAKMYVLYEATNENEEASRKKAEMFERCINAGKSLHYATRYTDLVLEEGLDEKQAERLSIKHEQDIKSGKYYEFADSYLDLKTFQGLRGRSIPVFEQKLEEGKSLNHAIKYAILKKFNDIETIDDKKIDEMIRIFEQKLGEGKSWEYSDKYSALIVINRLDKRKADIGASMYQKDEKVFDLEFHLCGDDKKFETLGIVSKLKDTSKSLEELSSLKSSLSERLIEVMDMPLRTEVDLYKEKLAEGKSRIYAEKYTELRCRKGLDNREASIGALICEQDFFKKEFMLFNKAKAKLYEKKIREGKSWDYVEKYYSLLNPESGIAVSDRYADKCATIYAEKITEGRSRVYVDKYIELAVGKNLPEEQADMGARIYEQKIKKGEKRLIADKYVNLRIFENKTEEQADREILIYKQELLRPNRDIDIEYSSEHKIDKYRELAIFRKLGNRQAEKLADMYDQEMKEKSSDFCNKYIDLMTFNGLGEEQASEFAEIYEQKLAAGNSMHYANKYIELRKIKGLSEEQAIAGAKMFDQKIIEGKSIKYANRYVNLRVIYGKSEKESDREATIFESAQNFNENKRDALKAFYIEKEKPVDKSRFDRYKRLTCAEDYEKLIKDLQTEALRVKEMREIFNKEVSIGKNPNYAREYARLRVICQEKELPEKWQKYLTDV